MNGTTPTASSTLYSGAISVTATETLQAVAISSTTALSGVASAAYTITGTAVAIPVISPGTGTYADTQTVSITDSTSGAKIYYTANGTTPTTASTLYSGTILVKNPQTINAIAVTSTGTSAVATATYTLTCIAPTVSPVAGTYAAGQTVTITKAYADDNVYYTTNGTTPTNSSTLYTAPITISATTTLKFYAQKTGFTASPIVTQTYTIQAATATPVLSLATGTYTTAQTLTITDATAGSTIYYTTNGTTPTTASTVYSGAITVSATETVEAVAISSTTALSSVASASYTISGATTPTVNFGSGFTSTGLNMYGATVTGTTLQLTDGGSSEGRIAWYKTPVNIQKFTTDFTFQQTSATADGFTFTLQNAPAGIWAVGGNASSLGYGGITPSIAVKFDLYNNAGEGSDSTGFYLNGAAPTTPFVDMTNSGVNLHSGDVMHAHLTYDGTTLTLLLTDTVTNASFTTSTAVNIPTQVGANTAYVGFTGGTGGLTAVQNILTWTYTVNQ